MTGAIVNTNHARRELDQAQSVAEVKDIRDKLDALRSYAKASGMNRDQMYDIAEAKVVAEHKGGRLLKDIDRGKGGRPEINSLQTATSFQQACDEAGLERTTAHRWQIMALVPDGDLQAYFATQREKGKDITSTDVYRMGMRIKNAENLAAPKPVVLPEGKFSTIVIDPPWDMKKIERDVTPNQTKHLDYKTMTQVELIEFGDVVNSIAHTDCHMFMWTTHKFLLDALELLQAWGWKYVLTMVWHKPGGFQPYGLPQYNCEFAVYARKGSPSFITTKAFNCCFEGPRREHSRKPDNFYETIGRVTDGRRVDVFSREKRVGFEQLGDETEKFDEAG